MFQTTNQQTIANGEVDQRIDFDFVDTWDVQALV